MRFICSTVLVCLLAVPAAQVRRPLASTDIEAITRIVMLEDTRRFDEASLVPLLQSTHPEVRRRAVIAIGRIVDPKGGALLTPLRTDKDPDVVAAVAFALGQLKDTSAVEWLASQMEASGSPSAVESARSLGKIKSPEARAALARFLTSAKPERATAPAVGEALLASGRFTTPGDIAPIVRWVSDGDVEIRWRAAWALFRLRDAAATSHLLKLTDDPSADVRFWAVRGLSPALVSAGGLDVNKTAERLRTLMADPDRRVRTEALRSLVLYDDDQSVQAVLGSLESPDAWLAVSAAEGLGRLKDRAGVIVPRLVAASAPGKPLAVRITALASLAALSPGNAVDLAASLATDDSLVARSAGIQSLSRLGPAGQTRLAALSADPGTKDRIAQAAPVRGQRAEPIKRTEAEYRQIVERWVVPAYKGTRTRAPSLVRRAVRSRSNFTRPMHRWASSTSSVLSNQARSWAPNSGGWCRTSWRSSGRSATTSSCVTRSADLA